MRTKKSIEKLGFIDFQTGCILTQYTTPPKQCIPDKPGFPKRIAEDYLTRKLGCSKASRLVEPRYRARA